MSLLRSQIKTRSEEYRQNFDANRALNEDLAHQLDEVRKGGSERAHQRHREQGKLLVRDRIATLIDEGTPFLELSALALGENTVTNHELAQALLELPIAKLGDEIPNRLSIDEAGHFCPGRLGRPGFPRAFADRAGASCLVEGI